MLYFYTHNKNFSLFISTTFFLLFLITIFKMTICISFTLFFAHLLLSVGILIEEGFFMLHFFPSLILRTHTHTQFEQCC